MIKGTRIRKSGEAKITHAFCRRLFKSTTRKEKKRRNELIRGSKNKHGLSQGDQKSWEQTIWKLVIQKTQAAIPRKESGGIRRKKEAWGEARSGYLMLEGRGRGHTGGRNRLRLHKTYCKSREQGRNTLSFSGRNQSSVRQAGESLRSKKKEKKNECTHRPSWESFWGEEKGGQSLLRPDSPQTGEGVAGKRRNESRRLSSSRFFQMRRQWETTKEAPEGRGDHSLVSSLSGWVRRPVGDLVEPSLECTFLSMTSHIRA